jgi:hypothetical protein
MNELQQRTIDTANECDPNFANTYLTDEMLNSSMNRDDNALIAQQIVVNTFWQCDPPLSNEFTERAIAAVKEHFTITPATPMTIYIFHDSCTTASEYVVTSVEELVKRMSDNFAEFLEPSTLSSEFQSWLNV